MVWIPVTLAAALFQILRTSRQHELRTVLDTSAAGFVRYAYGWPLALVVLGITLAVGPHDFPELHDPAGQQARSPLQSHDRALGDRPEVPVDGARRESGGAGVRVIFVAPSMALAMALSLAGMCTVL